MTLVDERPDTFDETWMIPSELTASGDGRIVRGPDLGVFASRESLEAFR